jgi:hypothetical protein
MVQIEKRTMQWLATKVSMMGTVSRELGKEILLINKIKN